MKAQTCFIAWIGVLAGCGPILGEPAVDTEPATTTPPPGSTTTPPSTSTTGGSTTGLSTTGSLDTSASESSDEAGNFIFPPDGCFGPPGTSFHCTTIECDYLDQDCPRGERCVPWANDGGNAWNANRCAPLYRDAVPPGGVCTMEGSPVSGISDCALGSMCWAVDPVTLQGVCVASCVPDLDACPPPSQCAALNDGSFTLCLSACHPLDPAGCVDDEACRFVPEVGGFRCLPQQGGEVWGSGRTCAVAGQLCAPDTTCIAAERLATCDESECCSSWCAFGDPMADTECALAQPEHACVSFYEPGAAPPGFEDVGVCAMPV